VDCLNHARYVQPRRTTGLPNGREPQGDGEPIVVVGVASHRGARESRVQGEVAQVIGISNSGRCARCERPKLC
jgi:hypothetical protein